MENVGSIGVKRCRYGGTSLVGSAGDPRSSQHKRDTWRFLIQIGPRYRKLNLDAESCSVVLISCDLARLAESSGVRNSDRLRCISAGAQSVESISPR